MCVYMHCILSRLEFPSLIFSNFAFVVVDFLKIIYFVEESRRAFSLSKNVVVVVNINNELKSVYRLSPLRPYVMFTILKLIHAHMNRKKSKKSSRNEIFYLKKLGLLILIEMSQAGRQRQHAVNVIDPGHQ
jgi:hypothetical protein